MPPKMLNYLLNVKRLLWSPFSVGQTCVVFYQCTFPVHVCLLMAVFHRDQSESEKNMENVCVKYLSTSLTYVH